MKVPAQPQHALSSWINLGGCDAMRLNGYAVANRVHRVVGNRLKASLKGIRAMSLTSPFITGTYIQSRYRRQRSASWAIVKHLNSNNVCYELRLPNGAQSDGAGVLDTGYVVKVFLQQSHSSEMVGIKGVGLPYEFYCFLFREISLILEGYIVANSYLEATFRYCISSPCHHCTIAANGNLGYRPPILWTRVKAKVINDVPKSRRENKTYEGYLDQGFASVVPHYLAELGCQRPKPAHWLLHEAGLNT